MEQGPCVAEEKYMHLWRVKTIQINFWRHDIFMQNSHFSKLKFSPKGPQFVLLMTFFLACITISIWGEKNQKLFSSLKGQSGLRAMNIKCFFTNLFEWISSARFCKWIEWAALLAWHPVLGGSETRYSQVANLGRAAGRHGKGMEKAWKRHFTTVCRNSSPTRQGPFQPPGHQSRFTVALVKWVYLDPDLSHG